MRTRTEQLGEVCDFIRGVTFPSGEGRSEAAVDTVACLTTSGVQQEVAWASRRFIPRDRVKNVKQVLQTGDILISTANSKELVGKSCIVGTPPFECTFGAFVTVARPTEEVHPRFLAYWMASAHFQAWCYRMSSNTTNISNLRVSELEEMPISLPSLPEQRRIAAMLEQADRLRRTRRYALELSESLLPAAFLEMFGRSNPASVRWPRVALVELCASEDDIRCGPFGTQLNTVEFRTSGVPLWGIKHVNAEFQLETDEFLSEVKAQELDVYSLLQGDLVMTRKGTIGNCALYPAHLPRGIMHSDLLRIRLKLGTCSPVFLTHQLHNSAEIKRQIEMISGGAIMAGINVGMLKSITVQNPPLALQRRFADLVRGHERLRAAQRESLRQSEHLFEALLHQAFEEAAL